jgi:hypothetical protein
MAELFPTAWAQRSGGGGCTLALPWSQARTCQRRWRPGAGWRRCSRGRRLTSTCRTARGPKSTAARPRRRRPAASLGTPPTGRPRPATGSGSWPRSAGAAPAELRLSQTRCLKQKAEIIVSRSVYCCNVRTNLLLLKSNIFNRSAACLLLQLPEIHLRKQTFGI